MNERNFEEMSDIYNEMMRYEDLGATDGMDKHFFTEILDGNVIKIPVTPSNIIRKTIKNFYYTLTDSSILYDIDNFPTEDETTDIAYKFLKSTSIEADKVELTDDTITLTPIAVKTLNLNVGDIIELEIFDDKSFELSKFEIPCCFN